MDLPINDKDLATIVNALSLGGDARLYHLLKEVKEVREMNPGGHYKAILDAIEWNLEKTVNLELFFS